MSEPYCTHCAYCGSPDVLDDAWWCERRECWNEYYLECERGIKYERRTPLTRSKSLNDLMDTKACVWGTPYLAIEHALDKLLACVYVRRVSHVIQP